MTWDDLRELRAHGLRPSLPVVVTTTHQRLLADEGCMVIQHKPGTKFHVELLDGLRVWLFLGDCGRAQAVVGAMNSKGVKPAELASWCPCQHRFDAFPVNCEVASQWH